MEFPVGEAASAGFEAFSVLRAAALPIAGPLADQLAERALRVTERGDFAVAQEALDALLRRFAAAKDAGAVLSGPRGRALGWYSVGRREPDAPHHDVLLCSVDPIEGSCSCPDYAKASLGVCQHIFLAADGQSQRAAIAVPPLRWDPVRPLTGPGDWLERLTWCGGPQSLTARQRRIRRLFRARDGERTALVAAVFASPTTRLAAVEALLELVRAEKRLAEPAIRPLLERERELLVGRMRHAPTAREIRRHCDTLRQTLFLYQREGVRRFLERGRLLLADDRGLGKTAQAIAACHVLVRSGHARRGLFVVPAPLRPHWLREWQRFTDLPLLAVDAAQEERARMLRRRDGAILLVDHDQVARDLPQLLRFRPDIVVLDEPERVGNRATGAAHSVKRLAARWRLVLTSTLMEDRLDELASIMEWLDEVALEPRWRLWSWHGAGEGRRAVAAGRNLDTLRQRLAPSVMRRVRREVLEQLPPRRDTVVAVPLTPAQRTVHDRLVAPIARIAAQATLRPASQPEFLRLVSLLRRQRMVCNGLAQVDFHEVWPSIQRRKPTAALLDSLASPKLAELRALVAALAITQERKVVVFSQWTRMLRLAAWASSDLLRVAELRAVSFTGEEGTRQRTEKLVEFHDDPAVRVLFASDASGVGLNLQDAASCCIHLDLSWNPAVIEQRLGRIHRSGQVQPVETYALVAEDGIEGRIAALTASGQALSSELFDGTSDTAAFERAAWFLARVDDLLGGAHASPEGGDGDADALDAPETAEEAIEHDATAGDMFDAAGVPGGSVASLFSQIQVTRRPDGRVAFEAPEPAAAALAELFEAVARLLAPAAPGGGQAGEPM